MLVLGRKEGESLIIGGRIRVKVLRCSQGQVTLGVEAPMDVKVLRDELWNKLSQENQHQAIYSFANKEAIAHHGLTGD